MSNAKMKGEKRLLAGAFFDIHFYSAKHVNEEAFASESTLRMEEKYGNEHVNEEAFASESALRMEEKYGNGHVNEEAFASESAL